MRSEVICPKCGKVNEMANDDGFVEGPREYHAECWRSLEGSVQLQAKRDAITHQNEFPGELVRGDWDTEAFTFCRQELELPANAAEALWPVYHDALHASV